MVADRLHSAAIHLLRRVRQQDVATGEGPARLSALSVLVFGGPKTLGELAAAEQVKPPTMSRIVSRPRPQPAWRRSPPIPTTPAACSIRATRQRYPPAATRHASCALPTWLRISTNCLLPSLPLSVTL